MQKTFLRVGLFGLALCLGTTALAFETPVNDGFVTDTIGLLSPADEESIEGILSEYQKETTNEIAIVLVQTMSGESIFDAALQIHRDWGVGTKENDNGIVLLVAYADREMFISVGYGLEGPVPDIVAKGVIDEDIAPAFREGEYAQGLIAAVDALKKHIGGEYTADRYTGGGDLPWEFLFFIGFLLFEFIGSFLAKSKSWWMGGILGVIFGFIIVFLFGWWLSVPVLALIGLIFDYFVSKIGPRRRGSRFWSGGGGFGGGSSGSGGFGGFGGGSSGGGGAGGSW